MFLRARERNQQKHSYSHYYYSYYMVEESARSEGVQNNSWSWTFWKNYTHKQLDCESSTSPVRPHHEPPPSSSGESGLSPPLSLSLSSSLAQGRLNITPVVRQPRLPLSSAPAKHSAALTAFSFATSAHSLIISLRCFLPLPPLARHEETSQ